MGWHEQKAILPPPAEMRKLAQRLDGLEKDRRITITPDTARLICDAVRFRADCVAMPKESGGFRVDVWSADGQHIVETLAHSPHGLVARAAFDRACVERQGYLVTLRQGIKTVASGQLRAAKKKPRNDLPYHHAGGLGFRLLQRL